MISMLKKILAHRINDRKETEYKVQWFSYPTDEATWKPAKNFDDPSIISDYRLSLGRDVDT